MASIEEILDKCSLAELKSVAKENHLPISGSKTALISMLASSVSAKKILNFLSNKQLQTILRKCGLPKSGTKNEMISRLLSSKNAPKQKPVSAAKGPMRASPQVGVKETAHKKGHDFEEQVAAWAKRKFKGSVIKVNTWARGITGVRPHNVDVHVQITRRGLITTSTDDIWIECKFKTGKSSVKRTEIMKLVNDAQMVYKFARAMEGVIYYNGLMLASNARFDEDALNYANEFGVLCVQYEAGKFFYKNQPANWLEEPNWLEQVSNVY